MENFGLYFANFFSYVGYAIVCLAIGFVIISVFEDVLSMPYKALKRYIADKKASKKQTTVKLSK